MEAETTVQDGKNWAPTIAKWSFLALTALFIVAAIYVVRGFLQAIIIGLFFSIILMPVYGMVLRVVHRFYKNMHRRRTNKRGVKLLSPVEAVRHARKVNRRERAFASGIMVGLTCLIVIIPFVTLVSCIVRQGMAVTQDGLYWIQNEMPAKTQAVIDKYNLQEKYDVLVKYYEDFVSGKLFEEEATGNPGSGQTANISLLEVDEQGNPVVKEVKPASEAAPVSESEKSSGTKAASEDKAAAGQAQASTKAGETPDVPGAVLIPAITDLSGSGPQQVAVLVPLAKPGAANAEQAKEDLGVFTQDPENSREINLNLVEFTQTVIEWVRNALMYLLRNVWTFIFNFFIMLFVMYQFFYDGANIWRYMRQISPLGDFEQTLVARRVKDVVRAVVFGVFGTSCTQAVLAMICFRIAGIPGLFWGALLGICSLVPIVGTTIVWLPMVGYLFLMGEIGNGIFILISCGCIIANLDCLLRPMIMRKSGDIGMSYMVLFLSILGGIQTFGIIGILYGPMIMGLCSIFLMIFSTYFKCRKRLSGGLSRASEADER